MRGPTPGAKALTYAGRGFLGGVLYAEETRSCWCRLSLLSRRGGVARSGGLHQLVGTLAPLCVSTSTLSQSPYGLCIHLFESLAGGWVHARAVNVIAIPVWYITSSVSRASWQKLFYFGEVCKQWVSRSTFQRILLCVYFTEAVQ